LDGQFAERHHAGLRVDTAITEGTVNFLVNHRMDKLQRCADPRREGGDLLLKVRGGPEKSDSSISGFPGAIAA